MRKILGKKKCACGRLIIIANKKRRDRLICGTCKTYGLEESKKQYEELKISIKEKK